MIIYFGDISLVLIEYVHLIEFVHDKKYVISHMVKACVLNSSQLLKSASEEIIALPMVFYLKIMH